MKKSYKWIAKEIESLDPYEDYERIWELFICYPFGEFVMNFLYTNQFPYYVMTPNAAAAVSRGGSGKLMNRQDAREADTANHFWKWFEYGPSHPITQQSINRVNQIHAGIAKQVGPGHYGFSYDYTYTMCMLAADYHRLRVRCGLPGYTENQKIASHLFWQGISELFRIEGDNSTSSEFDGLVTDFPDSWDGMVAYMEEHEAKELALHRGWGTLYRGTASAVGDSLGSKAAPVHCTERHARSNGRTAAPSAQAPVSKRSLYQGCETRFQVVHVR